MAAGHLAVKIPQEEFENSTKKWSLTKPHGSNNLSSSHVQSLPPPQEDEHHTISTNHHLKPLIGNQTNQIPLTEKSSAQTNWTIIGSHKVPFNQSLRPEDFLSRSSVVGLKLSQFASTSSTYPHIYQDKPKVVFHKSDKAKLISGMKNILVAKFSHGQPSVLMMRTFLSNRKLIGKFHVSFFDAKHIFIEFDCFQDFAKFWMKQKGVINGFPVRFFKWDELFDPSKESSLIPVWIHLPRLSLYLFEEGAIVLIASALGRPLHIDANNLNRDKVGYATVCIILDILKGHPSDIWIQFGEGTSDGKCEGFLQKIVYGFMPPFCSSCSHIGHQSLTCKRYNFGNDKKPASVQNMIIHDEESSLHSRSVLAAGADVHAETTMSAGPVGAGAAGTAGGEGGPARNTEAGYTDGQSVEDLTLEEGEIDEEDSVLPHTSDPSRTGSQELASGYQTTVAEQSSATQEHVVAGIDCSAVSSPKPTIVVPIPAADMVFPLATLDFLAHVEMEQADRFSAASFADKTGTDEAGYRAGFAGAGKLSAGTIEQFAARTAEGENLSRGNSEQVEQVEQLVAKKDIEADVEQVAQEVGVEAAMQNTNQSVVQANKECFGNEATKPQVGGGSHCNEKGLDQFFSFAMVTRQGTIYNRVISLKRETPAGNLMVDSGYGNSVLQEPDRISDNDGD